MSKITEAAEALEQATIKAEAGSQGTSETYVEEETTEAPENKEPSVLDIDAQDKVIFQGKEYTPEEFNKAVLMQADYTRKTQELAKERKFIDNLGDDLENVRLNPQLAQDFKKIYPEKFHRYLDIVLNNPMPEAEARKATQDDDDEAIPESLRRRMEEMQKKLDSYDEKFRQEQIEAANKHLDVVFDKFGQKYDLADEDAIINAAQRLLEDNRDNPNFTITDSMWERLFSRDHEKREQIVKKRQQEMVKQQQDKGRRALDGGAGGVAPGRERKKLSFDDATELAIQDLSS